MRNSALRFYWLAVVVLMLDGATKWAANHFLAYGEPVVVLPFFDLTLVYNTGAAFSFLADAGGWQRWGFILLAVAMVAGMLWWLRRRPPRLDCESAGLWMIVGGAIGNLVERIWDGRVTDFLDFHLGAWHYPTFNMADVAITLGAFCLLWQEFVVRPKRRRQSSERESETR